MEDAGGMSAEPAPTAAAWPAMSIAEAHARLTAPGSRFEMDEIEIRGIRTRIWKNAPPTLVDVFKASLPHAHREFVVYEGDRASYGAFHRAAIALAHELIARGVRKGDRVALIMRNLPEWPVAFFAAAMAGAIVTPLNAWWTGPELEFGLADSGSKIAIVDRERLALISERLDRLPALERIYVARTPAAGDPRVTALEDVIGRTADWAELPDQPIPDLSLTPEDEATIFYTSGTTGKPKGALGTHRNICTHVMTSLFGLARAYLRRGEAPPTPDPNAPQRVVLLVIPLFHATGSMATMVPSLTQGTKLVFMRKWDPAQGLALIERERVTAAGGVPTIAWQLVERPEREKYDLSSIESVGYGGAPAAPELVRRIVEVFPASQPGNGWGMTETSAGVTGHSSEDYRHRPDSCGPPTAVAELKILGPDGEVLPPSAVGELWCKGPQVVKGYWNNPQATQETFVDGWLRTGDLARLDEEGFCYIVDRAKDMLIRGGENIYCVEVENALYEHPEVMDAALIGLPHHTLGEEPAAVVTLRAGARVTEEELKAWTRERLAAFKAPVKIAFSTDTLPRNANGKILKPELKRFFGLTPD
jgi:long-chain acyl-CoA synthetase